MASARIPQPFRFLSSYGLTIVLLLLLMLLTLAGTLEQGTIGLYRAQQKYFNSLFLVWRPFSIPVPLPGAYLVFIVFFVNLVTSLLLRFRWQLKKIGLVICHLGFVMLLLGSFVTFQFSSEGALSLSEGEVGNAVQSYHQYELLIIDKSPPDDELVVDFPHEMLQAGSVLSYPSLLPIEVEILDYLPNCRPVQDGGGGELALIGHPGWSIEAAELEKENERNRPGARVRVKRRDGTLLTEGAIVAYAEADLSGTTFAVELQREQMRLPFEIELLSTRKEIHPGTNTPRLFESQVLVRDGATTRQVLIEMNSPLRYRGYTFFQSGFDDGPTKVSTLAVVDNPGELLPYASCLAIALGMLIHFMGNLARFVLKTRSRS